MQQAVQQGEELEIKFESNLVDIEYESSEEQDERSDIDWRYSMDCLPECSSPVFSDVSLSQPM